MKKLTIIRNILYVLMFLFALHISMRYVGRAFYNIDESSYRFYAAERDSADTVFVGSSHQYCSVDTGVLNDEYGFSSLQLSTSSQNFKSSYYAIMQAIEFQHPDTVVLECYSACFESDEQTKMEKHVLLDGMPNWSAVKWQAVKATGDPWYYYYYPISVFHEAWMDFTPAQFILPEMRYKAEDFSFYSEDVFVLEEFELIPEHETADMNGQMRFWLEKIVRLCRDEGVELMLYVAPYEAQEQDQKIFNGLYAFAQEYGLSYINTLQHLDEIGIDPAKDFKDAGHMNCFGQEKFTRYLAENFLS